MAQHRVSPTQARVLPVPVVRNPCASCRRRPRVDSPTMQRYESCCEHKRVFRAWGQRTCAAYLAPSP